MNEIKFYKTFVLKKKSHFPVSAKLFSDTSVILAYMADILHNFILKSTIANQTFPDYVSQNNHVWRILRTLHLLSLNSVWRQSFTHVSKAFITSSFTGFFWSNFVKGHFDLMCIKGQWSSHQYTEIFLKFRNVQDFQNFKRTMSWRSW